MPRNLKVNISSNYTALCSFGGSLATLCSIHSEFEAVAKKIGLETYHYVFFREYYTAQLSSLHGQCCHQNLRHSLCQNRPPMMRLAFLPFPADPGLQEYLVDGPL